MNTDLEQEGAAVGSDLEKTKLCAEAMGLEVLSPRNGRNRSWGVDAGWMCRNMVRGYDPLHDDAQAMALVKKLRLTCSNQESDNWGVFKGNYRAFTTNGDLNRAIVECVAKMQATTTPAPVGLPDNTKSGLDI